MVFVWLSILVLALSISLSVSVVLLLRRFGKKKIRWWGNALIIVGTSLALSISGLLIYLSVYSRAEESVYPYLKSDERVQVTKIKDTTYFDGPGTSDALIFYPGAKVDSDAYAPLAHSLAEGGLDVFVVDMPFHFPLFGIDKAKEARSNYSYAHFYIGGHSLGGNCASRYALQNPSDFQGLVLLGSYPSDPLPRDYVLCSVYGENDGVLNRAEYQSAKRFWPNASHETIIAGGNHANFGRYGKQSGDGESTITAKEQEERTKEAVLSALSI